MTEPTASPRAWLKVCTTCDRYGELPGAVGAPLADAINAATERLRAEGLLIFVRVPCLSGCHNPGNIALGASGKAKIRLHRLATENAADLAVLAERYTQSQTGIVPEEEWPERLQGHLATIIAPRANSQAN